MKKSLFTYYEIIIPSLQKTRALSLILANSLSYKSSKRTEKEFKITVLKKHLKQIEDVFKNSDIDYRIEKINSIFAPLTQIKKRLGVIIGLFFTLAVLYISSNTVWRIEIIGNETIEEKDILSELETAGLTLGTFVPSIDYDILHNRVLLNSKKLSWISVNITGNIAKVNVREKKVQAENTSPLYSNVIANQDGCIEQIKVINGKKEVLPGQIVKKGDILISGIIDSASEGVRYEQAKGVVFAYVNKKIRVEIPYKINEKIYTGRKFVYKNYKIYNFPINFSIKYSNNVTLYDKIERRELASLFGIKNIPIETLTTTLYEYEYKEKVLSKQEAIDKAFAALRIEMDKKLKNAELISKSVNTSFDENGFYIYCELYCLEDIAKIQEFYVSN